MTFTNSGFSANPKVTLTKPKLTSTNPKVTRNANHNPTPLTKDPSIQYGKLCVATTDGADTGLPGSFTRVCFVKFIRLSNVSDFIL